MKLVDANIIIYSVGSDHEFQKPSELVISQIRVGDISACIDVEVIQEVLHYFHTRRRNPELAIGLCDDLLATFTDIFAVDRMIIRAARDLLEAYPSLQTRDAIHAAVVFEHKLEGIISADRGLDIIGNLVRFDPKELTA